MGYETWCTFTEEAIYSPPTDCGGIEQRGIRPADSLCLNQFTLQSGVSDESHIVTCSFWVCGDEMQIRRISVHK